LRAWSTENFVSELQLKVAPFSFTFHFLHFLNIKNYCKEAADTVKFTRF
jgi:hypothetical protein